MRKSQDTHHGPPDQRDWHSNAIAEYGRIGWQAITGYGKRAKAEITMSRYKSIIGKRLRSRKFANQQTEVAIGCSVLNRMLDCARPKSVRLKVETR